MAMRVGLGMASEEPGEKIAVGESGFVTEADDDEVEGGYHIETLLFRADGGDEIAWAVGIELVAVNGQLQKFDRLESGIGRGTVEPKTDSVSGIGGMADEERGEGCG